MTDSPAMTSPSKSVEDFLKAVYTLQKGEERVSTNSIAEALAVKAPSVTDMAQRMMENGYVDYQKYHGVLLTAEGRNIALRIIRRHRLVELYLVKELGYALREVHAEAEQLEHVISERFVEAIASKMGYPAFDPHGDPIPSAEGYMEQRILQPLAVLALNTPALVLNLKSEDPDMLQHILDRGLKLDAYVEVVARDPFNGPLTLRVDGELRVIGHNVAEHVMVDAQHEE